MLNGSNTIISCLESLEKQQGYILEVLISDDSSIDDSLSLISSYQKRTGLSIRVMRNPNCKGISSNCNFLARTAKGNLIKFLFQDDLIDDDFFSKMLLPFKENSNVSLVFCNRRLKLESDSKESLEIYEGCRDLSAKWSKLNSIQDGFDLFEDPCFLDAPINKIGEPSSTIVSKKHFVKVGGFSEDFKQLLDLELWFKLFAVGKVAFVNKELSTFRIHQQQESHKNLINDPSSREAIKLYLSLLTDPLYTQISSHAKLKICKKLMLASVGDKIDAEVFNRKVLDLNEVFNRKVFDLNNIIDDKESEITKKSNRINFMEGTMVWKFRRSYMKFYYLYKKVFERSGKIINPPNLLNFKSFKNLHFPRFSEIKFTIIICYHNNFEETYLCLESILKNTSDVNYEVILVDDYSHENQEFSSCLHNIKIIRNEKNLGFLLSCNKGALSAIGEYLVFLNNDTQVDKNWLYASLSLLKNKNIGAVGSRLLYPNGILQEAGGIIWNDATGCNYGKGEDPALPEYNFVREVDYCSGASLITPKTVFNSMGGFSEEFEPAYYEDTDYCFRLKSLGLKVFYQPDSVVYHYEGLSCGTNLNEGVKSYQLKNASFFRAKWKHQLLNHLEPQSTFEGKYKSANSHGNKISILVIDSYAPRFDRESGSNRLLNIIKILKDLGYHVIFFPDNQFGEQPYTHMLCQLGVEVIYKIDESYLTLVELKKRIKLIDFAWICRPQLFKKYYKYLIKNKNLFLIYDTIDLHFQRIKREWELKGSSSKELEKKWKKSLALEQNCSSKASLTITVTHDEKKVVDNWRAKCSVVPNIHKPTSMQIPSFGEREGLLFIGSYLHPPNVDSVIWLCEEIMPQVWERNPNINLTLLGSNPTDKVLSYKTDKVFVPGFIHDVKPYFQRAKLFLSPLRYGAGMKGKIGQSMALGLPVITTKVGAEGMNLVHDMNSMIAESSKDFVSNICSLYTDEKNWNKLSQKSLEHIEQFSPERVSREIKKIITRHLDE